MTSLADHVREHLASPTGLVERIDRDAALIVTKTRIGLLSGSRKGADGTRAPTSFFGALAMRLTPIQDRSLDRPFASDGTVLRYQPELVRQSSNDDLESLLALTVMRCAALHPFRRRGRDAEMWNRAGELAVTPLMLDAGFTLPPSAQHDPRFKDHAAEQVYAIIEAEKPPPSKSKGGGGQGDGSKGDQQSQPQSSASQIDDAPADSQSEDQPSPQDEQDWKIAALQAEMASKKRGSMPRGADRLLDNIRRPRDNPWLVLRRFISSMAKADYRWTPPNRRYIAQGLVLPSLRSERVGGIAIWIDTSGSMTSDLLMHSGGHLQAILEDVRPERCTVIYCDAAVGKVEVFEQDETLELHPGALRNIGGGGGTDCRPVFAWLDEHDVNPMCFVGLTDMVARFPDEAPPFPVLWGSTSHIVEGPFGDVVSIQPGD